MNRHLQAPSRTLLASLSVCLICTLGLHVQRLGADTMTFLPDDAEAAEARFQLVWHAQQELDIAYFTIRGDAISCSFLNLLVDAARRGVRIRLVVDGMCSKIPPNMQVALLSSGAQIREYHRPQVPCIRSLTRRLHDKFLLRDRTEMIIGSRNIADADFGLEDVERENSLNLDVHLRGGVVAQACRYFDDLWESSELKEVDLKLARKRARWERPNRSKQTIVGQLGLNRCPSGGVACDAISEESLVVAEPAPLPDSCWYPPEKVSLEVDDDALRFLYDPSGRKNRCCDTRENIYRILQSAQDSIVLESPYFLPSGELGRILKDALARNVRVLILTNSLRTTDLPLVYSGYRNVIAGYQKLGAEVWEYAGPRTLHAKSLVVDGRVACVTSFNFDPRSAYLDTQLGVVACDPWVAAHLLAILEGHFARAMPIDGDQGPFSSGRRPPGIRAVEPDRYAAGEALQGRSTPDGRKRIGPAHLCLMRLLAPVVWRQL